MLPLERELSRIEKIQSRQPPARAFKLFEQVEAHTARELDERIARSVAREEKKLVPTTSRGRRGMLSYRESLHESRKWERNTTPANSRADRRELWRRHRKTFNGPTRDEFAQRVQLSSPPTQLELETVEKMYREARAEFRSKPGFETRAAGSAEWRRLWSVIVENIAAGKGAEWATWTR